MQFFTKELANRLGSNGVTTNCLDPGTVNTKMLFAGWGACGIDLKVSLSIYAYIMLFECVMNVIRDKQLFEDRTSFRLCAWSAVLEMCGKSVKGF